MRHCTKQPQAGSAFFHVNICKPVNDTDSFLPPEILKVISALLKNTPPSPESMEVRRVFLSDMIKLFNNSRENRR